MADFFGSLIGAGANLLGGLFGQSSADKRAQENIALQREFAQNAIQWKVADAKAAGIHPLFALGANTTSFSNVAGDTSLGDAIKESGQDIGRAVGATADKEARALTLRAAQLDVERKGLENDVLRAELASSVRRLTQPGTPNAAPGVKPEKDFSPVTTFGFKTVPNKNFSDVGGPVQQRWGEGAEWALMLPTVIADMWTTANAAGSPQSRADAQAKFNRYMDFLSSTLR